MSNHPLIHAVRSKDSSKVSKILESGTSPQVDIQNKYYPLHTAAQYNAVKEMGLLHQNGAHANEEDHFGQTALHVAASYGSALALKKLLLIGANPRRTDRNGNTPLHLAAHLSSGRAQQTLLEDLISAGADVNAPNNDGVTPLHLAIQSGSMDAVTLLLNHQANPSILTKNKSSALDFARTADKKQLQGLLNTKSRSQGPTL